MFLLGAEINWFEHNHNDHLLSHKLFLREIMTDLKSKERCVSRSSSIDSKDKHMAYINHINVSNNNNGTLFTKALLNDEYKTVNVHKTLKGTLHVLEDIERKIRKDHIVRPLKIFWVKADYALITRIVALLGTGLAMLLSTFLKSVDFKDLLSKLNT